MEAMFPKMVMQKKKKEKKSTFWTELAYRKLNAQTTPPLLMNTGIWNMMGYLWYSETDCVVLE